MGDEAPSMRFKSSFLRLAYRWMRAMSTLRPRTKNFVSLPCAFRACFLSKIASASCCLLFLLRPQRVILDFHCLVLVIDQ
jgi:hypothetical protein